MALFGQSAMKKKTLNDLEYVCKPYDWGNAARVFCDSSVWSLVQARIGDLQMSNENIIFIGGILNGPILEN